LLGTILIDSSWNTVLITFLEESGDVEKTQMSSQIQQMVAIKQMKEAFDNSPKPTVNMACRHFQIIADSSKDEVIRVNDMRDLRFMATIYRRQNRCGELSKLFSRSNPAMQPFLKYESDLRVLLVQAAQEREDWKTLEDLCVSVVHDVLQQGDLDRLNQLCTSEWPIVSGYLRTLENKDLTEG
jgi:N-terminal acetyltransferase B complex non-catalytic subunit